MKYMHVFIIGIALLMSCSNNDDQAEENSPVVGNWTSETIVFQQALDLNQDDIENNDYKLELPCFNHSILLNADGTGIYTFNLAARAPQPSPSAFWCTMETVIEIDWTSSNNVITINDTASNLSFQIDIISNNTLERNFTYDRSVLLLNGTDEVVVTFKKT